MLYIGLPSLFAIGVALAIVMSVLERNFERRLQEDVEMVARALQKPVSHALERQRQGSLRSALESALDIGRVYGAYLYSDDGALLASLGKVELGRQPSAAEELKKQHRGGGHYGRIQGELVYSYYVPVRLGGDRGTGLLRITRRKADIDLFMSRLRTGGAAFVVALALVMTITVILGYRGAAGESIQRLRRSIARIRAGDRSHRAELRGPYEVCRVVEGLNSMLDSIQEAEERIERERRERAELQAQLSASEKLASVGRLAAGIAHELGTPLGTIAGRVQRLMRSDDLTASMKKELEDMAAEVRRMERLVREVLDYGRREGLRRNQIAAQAVLMSAVRTALVDEDDASGDKLSISHEEDSPVFMQIVASRVEQALANLIRNAFQASPVSRVRVGWHRRGEQIFFTVEDDGPGVPSELRRRIFEPFVTTRSDDGTGLGLAIVEAVAHEHDGSVSVGEADLGGARFELVLPLEPAALEAPTPASPREDVGTHAN
ncbi:MAG: HAMP domain-containing sensor histidine kinase [Polyangia bacterium]